MTEPPGKTLGRRIFDGLAVATLVGFVIFCAVMVYCAANISDLRQRQAPRPAPFNHHR